MVKSLSHFIITLAAIQALHLSVHADNRTTVPIGLLAEFTDNNAPNGVSARKRKSGQDARAPSTAYSAK